MFLSRLLIWFEKIIKYAIVVSFECALYLINLNEYATELQFVSVLL
jgi:hypothetical protein